jgi:hypothetical protein
VGRQLLSRAGFSVPKRLLRALVRGASPLSSMNGEDAQKAVEGHLLFDAEWYRAAYSDALPSGMSEAEHYLTIGWLKGYDPGPLFKTAWYLDAYSDVRASGINPLLHYIRFGRNEGRQFREVEQVNSTRIAMAVRLPPAHDRLDEQQMLWARSLSRLGYDVDIYLVMDNDAADVPPARGRDMLNSFEPGKYVFSIVIGDVPMLGRILLECPAAIWIVEDESGASAERILTGLWSAVPVPKITATSIRAVRRLQEEAGRKASHVSYSPPAIRGRRYETTERIYPITYVGSYLSVKDVEDIYRLAQKAADDVASEIVACIDAAAADPTLDVEDFCRYSAVTDFLHLHRLSMERFSRAIWNVVTRRHRIPVLQSLLPQGLKLFGPHNWGGTLVNYPDLLKAYQRNRPIEDAGEAAPILDRSRISLILPHARSRSMFTVGAVEAMAAGSLVVTPYQEDADFFSFLGANAPVAMFKSLDELGNICRHYLENEAERKAVAERCQSFIRNECSIDSHIASLLPAGDRPILHSRAGEFRYLNVAVEHQ